MPAFILSSPRRSAAASRITIPGFFNGIFSLALVGGLLAPATLGYAASAVGVGVVIGLPLLGTFLVMTLLLLIWLESKVTGR